MKMLLLGLLKILPLGIAVFCLSNLILFELSNSNLYFIKLDSIFKSNYCNIINLLSIILALGLFEYKIITLRLLIISVIANLLSLCLMLRFIVANI